MVALSLKLTDVDLAELKARVGLEQHQARLYNLAAASAHDFKRQLQVAYQLPEVYEVDLASGEVTYEGASAERMNE